MHRCHDYAFGTVARDLQVNNAKVNQVLSSCQDTTADWTLAGGWNGTALINTGGGRAYWNEAPQVTTTINAGVTPTGMAITSDGQYAYIANNNNYGLSNGNYVSVLNLTTHMPETKIFSDTFNQPYTITLSTDGTKAYVTNSNAATITVIDTRTNEISNVMSGFDGPSGLAIHNTTGYVNNYGGPAGLQSGNGHSISVVNLQTETITHTINVDQAPAALTLSEDGTRLYVINYVDGNPGTGTMQIINTTTNTVLSTITGFSGPFAIAVHKNRAYVTNFGSNNFDPVGSTVSVVNLETLSILTTIELGIQPSGIDITPDGLYVYVSNYNTLYMIGAPTFSGLTAGQGTVNVIDTVTNTLLPFTIAVGQSPSNIVISPSGDFVYVSNFTSNTISVIRAQ